MRERHITEIAVSGLAVRTPVVGFGCSSLTGTDLSNANRVLETAFDAGVRHFDAARYYGYGEAEGILGRFLKSRRSEVTISTKFGIEPPRRTTALGVGLYVGRRIVRLLPGVRGLLQRGTQSLVKSGAFSAQQAQGSLETSLRELSTDHIDFYLLHDYIVGEQPPDELLAFLENTVKAGKIGSFGIGTGFENVLQALERQPRLCDVLQFQNSVLTRNCDYLPRGNSDRLVITHGALGGSYRSVLTFLEARRDVAKGWAAKLGCHRLDEDTLSALMLNYAADANPKGLVLFSSRDPVRVSRNVKAVLESDFSAAQIAMFGELVKQQSPPIVGPA
ncbi:MAG TPA: aldo/keto reductase [Candidatus Dormibacteraeota bacterium]|nr:aldo/keto reductase [Candidatus Dormibacteraeota bacterium]